METKVFSIEDLDKWFTQYSRILNKLDKLASKYDISFLQYNVLLHISQEKDISPSEIAKSIGLSKASISRILRILQDKSLIVRKYGLYKDRRRIEVGLSDQAELIIKKISEQITEIEF